MLKLNDKLKQALKKRSDFFIGLYSVNVSPEKSEIMAGVSVFIDINGEGHEMTLSPQIFLDLMIEEAKEEFLMKKKV